MWSRSRRASVSVYSGKLCSEAPGIPKNLAVAPLAMMSESKGSGSDPARRTSRLSQSTPVTAAMRKATLAAFPKMTRMGYATSPDSRPAVATS